MAVRKSKTQNEYWLVVGYEGSESRYERERPHALHVWVNGDSETTLTKNLLGEDGFFWKSVRPRGDGWVKGRIIEPSTLWHRAVRR
jgi:hypothetical protein